MANGNGSLIDIPEIGVVGNRRELRERAGDDSFLTFVNPLPDDPEDFRTGQTERLQGLVQDLATARVDAAQERERIREEAARDANARLLSTIGAQGITQAITGMDVGATERTQQAEQTLQQAQAARREAEAQAEEVEETAPVEADIRGAEAEQQAQQQAIEQAQQARQANMEQIQQAVNTVNQVQQQVSDARTELELMNREHQLNKDLVNLKFDRRLELARAEQEGMSEGDLESLNEMRDTAANFVASMQTLKGQVDSAFSALRQRGEAGDEGQSAQQQLNNIRENVAKWMSKDDGMLELEQKMKSEGLWNDLPEQTRQRYNMLKDVAQTIGGAGPDTGDDEYARVLRNLSSVYDNNLAGWDPNVEAADALVMSQMGMIDSAGSAEPDAPDQGQGVPQGSSPDSFSFWGDRGGGRRAVPSNNEP